MTQVCNKLPSTLTSLRSIADFFPESRDKHACVGCWSIRNGLASCYQRGFTGVLSRCFVCWCVCVCCRDLSVAAEQHTVGQNNSSQADRFDNSHTHTNTQTQTALSSLSFCASRKQAERGRGAAAAVGWIRKCATLYQAGGSRMPRKTREKQFKLSKQTRLIWRRRWMGRLDWHTRTFTPNYFLCKRIHGWMEADLVGGLPERKTDEEKNKKKNTIVEINQWLKTYKNWKTFCST